MTDTQIAPFVQPTAITLELPTGMGTLIVRPMTDTRIMLQSHALLIAPNLYSFTAQMELAGDTWYYHNKANIGVTGGRPTPKKAQAALEAIAKQVNRAFSIDPNFQEEIATLKVQEEARKAHVHRITLQAERRCLQRHIEDASVKLGYARRAVIDREEELKNERADLEKFDLEHPEVQTWDA